MTLKTSEHKQRIKKAYTIPDFYSSYIKHVGKDVIYDVGYKKFREVVVDYFKYIADRVIQKSAEVRLPARMGSLFVKKSRPFNMNRRGHNVDFKLTNELGKTILHLNEHSNGYRYRFYWQKRDMVIKNKSMYEMIMSRDNKRLLAYNIKNRIADYIEL